MTEEPRWRDKLIDGKAAAARVVEEVAAGVKAFSTGRRAPHLVVIRVGEDPASVSYVKSKVKRAEICHIDSTLIELDDSTSEGELVERVEELNGESGVDGILVQLPLPPHIDQQRVIETIVPAKDVDGFHPYNLGRLASDKPVLVPCTPLGISELLTRYGVETSGKHAVVVGRSVIVGKPMALLLARKSARGDATVTICHSRTSGLDRIVSSADILVAAIGKPRFITGEMIKPGAVVVDVGMNRVADESAKNGYRWIGDVDFDSAVERASLITPVPGGVGPMTVAMLMKNTLLAARLLRGESDGG